MTPVGFETTISAGERPQTYALGRAATGTCSFYYYVGEYFLGVTVCLSVVHIVSVYCFFINIKIPYCIDVCSFFCSNIGYPQIHYFFFQQVTFIQE